MGGISGSNSTPLGEHRRKFCEHLFRCIGTRTFVRIYNVLSFRLFPFFIKINLSDSNGQNAWLEMSFRYCGNSLPVGIIGEFVLVLTGYQVNFSNFLCGKSHAEVIVRLRLSYLIIGNCPPACGGHKAHAFSATSDNTIGHTGLDLGSCDGDGF